MSPDDDTRATEAALLNDVLLGFFIAWLLALLVLLHWVVAP